jgi:hypothetical protein
MKIVSEVAYRVWIKEALNRGDLNPFMDIRSRFQKKEETRKLRRENRLLQILHYSFPSCNFFHTPKIPHHLF